MKIAVLGKGLLGSQMGRFIDCDFFGRANGFDITDPKTFCLLGCNVEGVIDCNYDVIINCIANTDTYSEDKESMMSVNYKGVVDLVNFCNTTGTKLVQVSTAYVYSGSVKPASESDVPVHAPNWYSYSKLIADAYVETMCKDYLICRVIHKKNIDTLYGYIDVVGNFCTPEDTAVAIASLVLKKSIGIYNIGGHPKSAYSYYRSIGINCEPDLCKLDRVPKNTVMSIDKMLHS